MRIVHSDIYGTAQSQPAYWTGGTVTPTHLPGIGNIPTGIADDATGLDEVVGTVSIESIPSTARPFLRRRFRRDELDPNSPILLPKLLQLPGSETIDLNSLLPPNSGWTLLTATAINAGGQITGMGLMGGQPRAYRLSPPVFESPLRKVLTKAEVLTIFGGVAAGGGGFGITPGGQIIPIPPPRPDALTVEHLSALVRDSLHELSVEARKTGNEAMFRSVVQALVREASTLLNDR